jgi:hypothetical protein
LFISLRCCCVTTLQCAATFTATPAHTLLR